MQAYKREYCEWKAATIEKRRVRKQQREAAARAAQLEEEEATTRFSNARYAPAS